jgi:hypothetical protein
MKRIPIVLLAVGAICCADSVPKSDPDMERYGEAQRSVALALELMKSRNGGRLTEVELAKVVVYLEEAVKASGAVGDPFLDRTHPELRARYREYAAGVRVLLDGVRARDPKAAGAGIEKVAGFLQWQNASIFKNPK